MGKARFILAAAALAAAAIAFSSAGAAKPDAAKAAPLAVSLPPAPTDEAPVPAGKVVLLLYKSTEGQSEKDCEAFYYCVPALKAMGLEPRLWDADKGLPDAKALAGVRAIASWFRGASMKGAREYLVFLRSQVDAGRKVVVIDNLGAYQERSTGAYLDPPIVNLVLARLGIMYAGDWTDDGSLVEVSSRDSAMAEKEAAQDPAWSRLFYRFIPSDPDAKVWLALRRKDKDYAPSPAIITNGAGGFALSRYVFRDDKGLKFLLDVPRFLREALFPGCPSERALIVHDPANTSCARILRYARDLLGMAKFPLQVMARDAFAALVPGDLSRYSVVILDIADDKGIAAGPLKEHLARGGSLVSLRGGKFGTLAPLLLGRAKEPARLKEKGYRLRLGWTLGEALAPESADYEWSVGSLVPEAGAEEIASNPVGTVKAGWRGASGRVVVWNWDAFDTGDFLGLLLESVLASRPAALAAKPGVGAFFVDDWPLPMFDVEKAPVKGTDADFYARTWWPDLSALLAARGIAPASFLVFNYNATVAPPFTEGEFFVARGMEPLAAARALLASGAELGLHGYNHVSLSVGKTASNLASFADQAAIKLQLLAAKEEWTRLLGESSLPFAYVAPNNIISVEGRRAIAEVLPSVKSLSLVYTAAEGEETLSGFGPDPYAPGLYDFPRTSYGYVFGEDLKRALVSSAGGFGVVSHFVHPDDVYDPARSMGLGWDALKADLGKALDFVAANYPWIRFMPLRDAVAALRAFQASAAELRLTADGATVKAAVGTLFELRSDRAVASMEGAELVKAYRSAPFSIIRTTAPEAKLTFAP